MPTITIDMFAGRTREQQQELVTRVTEAVSVSLSVQPEQIKIRLNEVQPHLTAVGGIFKAEPAELD